MITNDNQRLGEPQNTHSPSFSQIKKNTYLRKKSIQKGSRRTFTRTQQLLKIEDLDFLLRKRRETDGKQKKDLKLVCNRFVSLIKYDA